jgi:transposase
MEHQIQSWHRFNALSSKLDNIPRIGPITASALVGSVGDAKDFASGRELAAWLGLVPRQHSSGGKTNSQEINKRGDTYLRTLLVHSARAVIRQIERKANVQGWLGKLLGRRNKNVAMVALANKNVRVAWALLANERNSRSDYAAA